MTKPVHELTVYFTVLKDGAHLAVSTSEPVFCVSGKTLDEAKGRVEEIIDFHNDRCTQSREISIPEIPSRTLTPFVPSHVERYTADCVGA